MSHEPSDDLEAISNGLFVLRETPTRVKMSLPRQIVCESVAPMVVIDTYEPNDVVKFPVQNRVVDACGRVGWIETAALRRV